MRLKGLEKGFNDNAEKKVLLCMGLNMSIGIVTIQMACAMAEVLVAQLSQKKK